MINEYIALFDQTVCVTCADGKSVYGKWVDCLNAEDANEDERQENSVLIQSGSELIEIYESEIAAIRQIHA